MSECGLVLLNMIHERTKLKPLPKITAANYNLWVAAWFETAEEMVKEFETKGLPKTAECLRLEINWQRKIIECPT